MVLDRLLVRLLLCLVCGSSAAQTPAASPAPEPLLAVRGDEALPEHPEPAQLRRLNFSPGAAHADGQRFERPVAPIFSDSIGPMPAAPAKREPFHWKGLLLQSLAFQALEHGPRIMAADAEDRHLLLNKPFWSDYWASLGQYNMRRWNDGDSVIVNYVGHPTQGAISGYIQIQNDPRGRDLRISRDGEYWRSRFRAFLWETVYSTEFEIGPISEASIFNQGGYTYPLGCTGHDVRCERTARYTNNTGWVDFIVTPIGGTLVLLAGDALDRYVSDPKVARYPHRFRYKVLRSSLNPPRSLANMLRGKVPWYRDYEQTAQESWRGEAGAPEGLEERSSHPVEMEVFYSTLSLPATTAPCRGCRQSANGIGAATGIRVGRYVEAIASARTFREAGSPLPGTYGGSLQMAHVGLRSGVAGRYASLNVSLAPGFASYSRTKTESATTQTASPTYGRSYHFSFLAAVSGDVRLSSHVALRGTVEQVVIRYKSEERDAPGIGTPPRLSFLSHDNYINQTNWGVRVGPVLRF